MAAGFAGEAKTDVRDAIVIANTVRMRRDFLAIAPPTDLIAKLALLLTHRADLVQDWVRTVNRLRRLMLGISPALVRALTFTNVATLILITGFQTPDQIRAAGRGQLVAHLRHHRALNVAKVADTAIAAAAQQHLALPGQDTAAALAADVATQLLELRRRIKDLDKAIAAALDEHPQSKIVRSLPGMGPLVAAEFAVAVGDLSTFVKTKPLRGRLRRVLTRPRNSGRTSLPSRGEPPHQLLDAYGGSDVWTRRARPGMGKPCVTGSPRAHGRGPGAMTKRPRPVHAQPGRGRDGTIWRQVERQHRPPCHTGRPNPVDILITPTPRPRQWAA